MPKEACRDIPCFFCLLLFFRKKKSKLFAGYFAVGRESMLFDFGIFGDGYGIQFFATGKSHKSDGINSGRDDNFGKIFAIVESDPSD